MGKNKSNAEKEEPKGNPSHYAAIGASAGGLEAIETFFSNMPPVSGMAFIVIQHLSPDYKSLMVELLSKKTRMPVHRAEDGMTVERDNVYLIPPRKNLSIFHGKLILSDQDHNRGLNLPIDIFLHSLSEDQGEKGIAIILSGTGSDGMRGVRAIKEYNGMVMVQDEKTAKFDGMPRSAINTGLADFILPPEEMPEQLLLFIKHPYVAKPELTERLLDDDDGLSKLFAILRDKFKVDFTNYKPSTVLRRIERRMTINHVEDIKEYVSFLVNFPGETAALFRELLIGVTRFFRDTEVFDYLGESVFPEVLKGRANRELRFWVAGCSTGEEAYSIAILLRECMESMGVVHDVKIFATDVDSNAIQFAANGTYPESIAADVSPKLLAKYFHKREESFQIARTIREMVVFAPHNLIKDPPFTNIDFISCRNLLIYLQPVLQQKVIEFFNFSLKSEGILLLGTSETTGDMGDFFNSLNHKLKIFKSKGKVRQITDVAHISDIPGRRSGGYTASFHGPGKHSRMGEEERILDRLIEAVSSDYFPLVLIVNESLEVLHIIGDVKDYFKLPSGKLLNDISRMAARELAIPVSTGIPKVFREKKDLRFSNIQIKQGEQGAVIDLLIKPLPGKKGQDQLAAVFIIETTRVKNQDQDQIIQTFDLSKEAEEHINDLEQELQFTRENLQATIEELETSNEELQATNEELLASNEELQSTNEELQSTNEELYTVNAEYHKKIIELTEIYNDLDNVLTASQIGKMILDENLEVRRFSKEISNVFKLLGNDMGRPITHITHYIKNFDPVTVIKKVQQTHEHYSSEVETIDGRIFLMRVIPYKVGPDSFSGTVVSFVDITEINAAKKELLEKDSALEETASLAKVGWWKYVNESGEHTWSDEVYRIHEVEPGKKFTPEEGITFYHVDDREIISKSFNSVISEGIPYDLTLRIITAKGNLRWIRTIGKPVLEDGTITGVFGVFQDITTITEARQTLLESRELFSRVANSSPALVWIAGLDKGCTWFNEPWLRFTGRTMEQELGAGWTEGVHPDDYDRCMEIYTGAFDRRESFSMEYRLRRFDNVYRWIYDQGQPYSGKSGEFLGYIGSCLDITDLKNAEYIFKEKKNF